MPSADILLSPVSRRQSPRVWAADSALKTVCQSPNKTPVKSPVGKSPVCGTITAGLDSPSQNTRMRTAATPTRKSVRAALFAKSPAIKACNSSIIRTEVSDFQKKLKSDLSSPDKSAASEISTSVLERRLSANRNLSFMSPRKGQIISQNGQSSKNLDAETAENLKFKNVLETMQTENKTTKRSPEKPVTPKDKFRNKERAVLEKYGSLNFGLTPNSKQGPTIIQRTPSPTKKQKTKTPESFDKWHRRKPRSSQSSPMIKKQEKSSPEKSVVNNAINKGIDANVSVKMKNKITESEITDADQGPLRRINSSQNKSLNFSRKRCLQQSPEKSFESPGKRQRISRTRSIRIDSGSSQQNFGSQGFDITGSFSEFSQNSGISSVDYLSASNDEVFMSQNDGLSQDDVEMADIENKHKGNVDIMTLSQSGKGWFSSRHRTLERITSGEFSPSRGPDQRSDSPIFGSAVKANRNRNISGENSKMVSGCESPSAQSCSSNRDSPSSRNSPSFRKSPANKKYSPVVSANSLMHLIQSPLLTPCEDDDKHIPDSWNPRNRKNIHGDRSRRSLKLQN